MDLRQLEYALAVADEGGFTAAARRLRAVQSAVSSTVSALERDLGVTLFERTTRQVRLTEAGKAFVPAARQAVAAVRQIRPAVAATATGLHGSVNVGMVQGVWVGLRRALLDMAEQHPAVAVSLRHEQGANVLQERVRDMSLDLAVVSLTSQQERGLVSRLLWEEPMVLVTGRDHPLAGDDPIRLAKTAGQAFVDFPEGWSVRHEVDRAYHSAKVPRPTGFEVNDLLSAADLVEDNLAFTILPRSLAARFPQLRIRQIASHVPHWRVVLIHRQGDLTPPARAFLNLIR